MRIRLLLFMLTVLAAGCGLQSWSRPVPLNGPTISPENPIYVSVADREFMWNQLVDSVDDHFRIDREERIHVIDEVITEGRIETAPLVGSSILEPWRSDSSPGYEKLLSTFQSVRRQATVRATAVQGGYLIEVVVNRELEDVSQPEHATAGASTFRNDSSLDRGDDVFAVKSQTLGWIPMGRDYELEQRILADIKSRLGVAPAR